MKRVQTKKFLLIALAVLVVIGLFIAVFTIINNSIKRKNFSRPDDYSLMYWVKEEVDETKFDSNVTLPAAIGCEKYLDTNYKAIKNESGNYVLPTKYVAYTVEKDKEKESKKIVTTVDITDEKVFVFGFNIKSDVNEFTKYFEGLGFKKVSNSSKGVKLARGSINIAYTVNTEISIVFNQEK